MVNLRLGRGAIYAIDLVIVLFSVGALMYFIGFSQPNVIAPVDSLETTETEVLFSVENANLLLIDDNDEFTTPDFYDVEEGLRLDLIPGTYYWKVMGKRSSEIRKFTIVSEVKLEFKKVQGNEYKVVNVGNNVLNVDLYSNDSLIERFKLRVNEEGNVDGDRVVGGLA